MFLGHKTPSSGSADAVEILKSFQSFFTDNKISTEHLVAVGWDGTNTNVDVKAGIIKLLEKHLNRAVHWFICQLHGNELPWRHLIKHLGFDTSGPTGFTGEFGKTLMDCTSKLIVQFTAILSEIPIILKSNLSTDQQYFYEIYQAVINGFGRASLARREPGKIVHSRWVTTANRVLRL